MAHKSTAPRLNEVWFDKHVKDHFTPSQNRFSACLKDWIHRPRNEIILLSGGPGTGKTHVVKTCLSFVENASQVRMAYTARIASEIGGRTIHSTLRLDWTPGSVLRSVEQSLENEVDVDTCLEKSAELKEVMQCFGKPSIVIVDEIGMIPFWLLYWIVRYFFDAPHPVLFIGMGDSHQLRPVRSAHNVFGVDCLDKQFETHRITLMESKRFFESYKPIVQELRNFVNSQDVDGLEEFVRQKFPVVDDIDEALLKRCSLALAFRNDTVDSYNRHYINYMMPGRKIRLYQWNSLLNKPNLKSFVDVKENCKIFVTENGVSEVTNGTPLLFKRYLSDEDVVECESLAGAIVRVRRNAQMKFPIAVGFAATVHKFQGFTIDDKAIVINFNNSKDLNLIYTALSRVKSVEQILAITM